MSSARVPHVGVDLRSRDAVTMPPDESSTCSPILVTGDESSFRKEESELLRTKGSQVGSLGHLRALLSVADLVLTGPPALLWVLLRHSL